MSPVQKPTSPTAEGAEPTKTPPKRQKYGTRVIMTAVAIGAAWGLVQIPMNFLVNPISTTLPVIAVSAYGIWGMSALVPLAVLKRGGTGIIGAAASGVVGSLSPYGVSMVVMMAIWGVLMELTFALLRYRHFGWRTFLLAGVVVGVVATAMTWSTLNLASMRPLIAIMTVVVAMTSFIGCSVLSWFIGKALARAGIGDSRRRAAHA